MSRYEVLKETIKNILLDIPIDVTSDDGHTSFELEEWESAEERDFSDNYQVNIITKQIGTDNIIQSMHLLYQECTNDLEFFPNKIDNDEVSSAISDIFNDILSDLEEDKIIRRKPEYLRKNLKVVVDNDRPKNGTED